MSIKILQITAAYKPAYIYGGPTMSVAKLCETLVKSSIVGRPSSNVHRETKNEKRKTKNEQGKTINEKSQSSIVHRETTNKQRTTKDEQRTKKNISFDLEVFTTTANGKTELNVTPNEIKKVDGVKVTYFKRLTKDHTHFSPALLLALRSEILKHNRKVKAEKTSTVYRPSSGEIIETKNEQRTTNNEQTNKGLIIHIHAWWNLVSIFSCAIAKWYKVPVILSPRGMLTAYTNTNRNTFEKEIIHSIIGKNLLKYCHIHVTSEKEKRDVLSIITPQSITIIPNLVELSGGVRSKEQGARNKVQSSESKVESLSCDLFTETNAYQSVQSTNRCNQPLSEHFKLIFLSRIEEKKGLNLLFEALTNLPFKWNLTIAGSGEETYIESLKLKVKSLKIENRIDWVGQVKNEDKFKLLAEHDLMVLTSYNENFANVVIESLSVGTPVLLSKEVGLADFVAIKNLGWITDLAPINITKNIILAFESSELRTIIREKAPQVMEEDFNSKILIEKYFTLYAQINNGRL